MFERNKVTTAIKGWYTVYKQEEHHPRPTEWPPADHPRSLSPPKLRLLSDGQGGCRTTEGSAELRHSQAKRKPTAVGNRDATSRAVGKLHAGAVSPGLTRRSSLLVKATVLWSEWPNLNSNKTPQLQDASERHGPRMTLVLNGLLMTWIYTDRYYIILFSMNYLCVINNDFIPVGFIN